MMPASRLFDRAVAAPPTHPAPQDHDRRPSTPLAAVFRRLGGMSQTRTPRSVPISARPQLLGFAELVAEVPPVEDFLPATEEAATLTVEGRAEVQIAAVVETPAQPEPEPEPVPESPPPPSAPPPARPQNLVGRPGQRLGDAPAASTRPVSEAGVMPAPAARAAPTHTVHHPLAEPPQAPFQMAGDRAGRPSMPRNRRAYRRARVPAEIEIGGVPCTLIDVSIGGFAASGVPPIEPNALMPVTIRLVIDGIEVGTQLSARIVYVTHGRSAGRFIDLSPSQMAFLRYLVTWRGESVGAVGTTTLLDAIAGGAERGFASTAGEYSGPETKSHWWAGLIGKKVNRPR